MHGCVLLHFLISLHYFGRYSESLLQQRQRWGKFLTAHPGVLSKYLEPEYDPYKRFGAAMHVRLWYRCMLISLAETTSGLKIWRVLLTSAEVECRHT
jgi:hypothetical protein